MSSAWQKTKLLFGFGSMSQDGSPQGMPPDQDAGMRLVAPMPDVQYSPDTDTGSVRPIPPTAASDVEARAAQTRTNFVRPIPSTSSRPAVVTPMSFDDAKDVGDCFRGGQAVIVNLQHGSREVARRLIDFSSGLCYGLDGRMERVSEHVYLLTPSNVEVSAEERRRIEEAGYRDP